MPEDAQFWLNWWVNLGMALATLAAVIVALFGSRIQAWLFKPGLALSVPDPRGESIQARITSPSGAVSVVDARYYHLRVTNRARWPAATGVQVFLIRLEEPGPDGQLQIKWASEVPLRWMHQEVYPVTRTVGPNADADLCSVLKQNGAQLHPLIMPNNLATYAQRQAAFDMVLSFQARSQEEASPIKRIPISWDGKWQDGEAEMAQHLVVRELN